MVSARAITSRHGQLWMFTYTADGNSDDLSRLPQEESILQASPVIDGYVPLGFSDSISRSQIYQRYQETTTQADSVTALCVLLAARRQELGLSQKEVAQIIGMSDTNFRKIENGTWSNYQSHFVQKLCVFYHIRFNYLPFDGPLLFDPVSQWQDIMARTLTLGLKPSEFKTYLGMSFQDLRRLIFSKQLMMPDVWEMLTYKLHMRLLPPPRGILVNEATVTQLYEDLEHYQQIWKMSDAEVSAAVGCKDRTYFGVIKDERRLNSYVTEKIAIWFGYKMRLTQGELPVIDSPQYLDAELAKLIRERMQLMGYDIANLAEAIGRKHYAVDNTLAILEGTKERDVENAGIDYLRGRDALHLICEHLAIKLHQPGTKGTLPQTRFVAGENWLRALPRLMATLREIRIKLRIPIDWLEEDLHSSHDSLGKMEALADQDQGQFGSTSKERLHKNTILEKWMEYFHVVIDPFEQCASVILDHEPTAEELGKLLSQQVEDIPVSRARLTRLANIRDGEVRNYLDGLRSPRWIGSISLARCLHVNWPGRDSAVPRYCPEREARARSMRGFSLATPALKAKVRRWHTKFPQKPARAKPEKPAAVPSNHGKNLAPSADVATPVVRKCELPLSQSILPTEAWELSRLRSQLPLLTPTSADEPRMRVEWHRLFLKRCAAREMTFAQMILLSRLRADDASSGWSEAQCERLLAAAEDPDLLHWSDPSLARLACRVRVMNGPLVRTQLQQSGGDVGAVSKLTGLSQPEIHRLCPMVETPLPLSAPDDAFAPVSQTVPVDAELPTESLPLVDSAAVFAPASQVGAALPGGIPLHH